MQRKMYAALTTLALSLSSLGSLSAADTTIGVVNMATCITDSKLGKQEQAAFETLKKQMASLVEEKEKQMGELMAKFNDTEYMDGVSPETEEQMKNQYRTLQEEMMRAQNQYYQVMQQANMRILQGIGSAIGAASETVAKNKKLSIVLNKDATFYFAPAQDVTPDVIVQMDKTFDSQPKTTPAPTTPSNPDAK